MANVFPSKLKKGDEIRVIAPSRSISILSEEGIKSSTRNLEKEGFNVSFGKNVHERDIFDSSSIKARIHDLHQAFKDKNVKAVLTVIGGFNSNQLLKYIDYNLLKNNPKIICGFSDITALTNAIYAKTGIVTYSGPHFSSFSMERGFEYTKEYFEKCLASEKQFVVEPSAKWSDDAWWRNQEKRKFIDNKGYEIINEGEAEGVLIGGNMCTFILLHGTEYMPSLKDTILFLEEDELEGEATALMFDRDLQAIIHQPGFDGVRGIVIGRFQKKSEMTADKLKYIIKTKKELENIPVIANVDFGHTTPCITFPIGGTVRISAKNGKAKIEILNH